MNRALIRGAGIVAVLAVCAIQLVPFYTTLTTALKARSDLSSAWSLPTTGVHWQNFAVALDDGNILRAMINSGIVTVASTLLVCVLGALAGYALARRRTRGNRLILGAIVALMMIPPLSILVPIYSMFAQWGWLNTYGGATALMVASQLPLSIFLYTLFIRNLPVSLEEAAVLDGASTVRALRAVVLPLLTPVTATVVILASVSVWNEYALSVFVLRDPAVRTTAPAVGTFLASQGGNPNAAAAAALLTVVPVVVVFLFLQRSFIKGMVAGHER